jgi:hypothetical protein
MPLKATQRPFLAYFPYTKKMKTGLWDLHAVCVSVNSDLLTFYASTDLYEN